jgi:lysophospholipase L1-like esterase
VIRIPPVKGLGVALTLAAALAGASRPTLASSMQTYLALGDSLAFGETDFTHNPSNGDRGYVEPFANFLATQNGGVAPNVVNLALDGETGSTFLNGGPATGNGSPGQPGYTLNTNYATPVASQNLMMLETIVHKLDAGQTISNVTLQVGANDLLSVLANPTFASLTPQQQQAQIGTALSTLQANYTTIVSELHSLLPHANIYLMGYYDPYNFPGSKVEPLAGPAIQALNKMIQSEAAASGAKYVDLYDALNGLALQDTLISSGNVHPNAAGYAVIATQLENAAVPEPSTVLIFGAGLAGWLVLSRRRRAA